MCCQHQGYVILITGLMTLTIWPLCTTAILPPNLMGYCQCVTSSADTTLQIPGSTRLLCRQMFNSSSAASIFCHKPPGHCCDNIRQLASDRPTVNAVTKADVGKVVWLSQRRVYCQL